MPGRARKKSLSGLVYFTLQTFYRSIKGVPRQRKHIYKVLGHPRHLERSMGGRFACSVGDTTGTFLVGDCRSSGSK